MLSLQWDTLDNCIYLIQYWAFVHTELTAGNDLVLE